MPDFIKDTIKVVLTPLSVLYAFGFLCMTSYLSQFGMSSFDLLNSRFILAGLYPLTSIAACMFIVLKFGVPFYEWDIWGYSKYKNRYVSFIKFGFGLFSVTAALSLFFHFSSRYTSSHVTDIDTSNFLFEKTQFGSIVESIATSSNEETRYLEKFALSFYPISLIAVLIFAIIHFLFSRNKNKENTPTASRNKKEGPPQPKLFISLKKKFIIILADALLVCIFFGISSLSQVEISKNIINVSNIDNIEVAGDWLILGWAISFSIPICVVLPVLRNNQTSAYEKFRELFSGNLAYNTFVFAVIPSLASAYIYGSAIFPRIPFELGGGMPRIAHLTLHEGAPKLPEGRIYLLDETSKYFLAVVVNTDKRQAISIRKDIVDVIETSPMPSPEHPAGENKQKQSASTQSAGRKVDP